MSVEIPTITENKRTVLPRGVIDTLSGSAGGTALVLVGHPFDTLKVYRYCVYKYTYNRLTMSEWHNIGAYAI